MPLTDDIIHLTQQYGSTEEKQLVSRWQIELRQFITPFEREIRLGHHALEIGLEPKLALKLIIKRRKLPPVAGLLRLAEHLPAGLQQVALKAAANGLDFHVGIRLNPESAHREIYLYDLQGMAIPQLPILPEGMIASFYGVDELQGMSAYCTDQDNPVIQERLQPRQQSLGQELKMPLNEWVQGMWLHYRLQDNSWDPQKFGLEYKDVPIAVTMRVLSHFKLPYFSYLIPRQGMRKMVIGGPADGRFSAFYFTVM